MASGHAAICGFPAPEADRVVLLFRRSKRETWMLLMTGKTQPVVTAGSVFTGFFEPDLCDVSRDGEHFVYYAVGRDTRHFDTRHKYWTAICRPPYVRALSFLPHRARGGGGGAFADDGTVTVDPGGHPAFAPEDAVAPPGLTLAIGKRAGPRLCDRGWVAGAAGDEKPWLGRTLIRRATASSRDDGFAGGAYAVRGTDGESPLDDVGWADINSRDQLMIARGPILTVYPFPKTLQQNGGHRFDLADITARKNG